MSENLEDENKSTRLGGGNAPAEPPPSVPEEESKPLTAAERRTLKKEDKAQAKKDLEEKRKRLIAEGTAKWIPYLGDSEKLPPPAVDKKGKKMKAGTMHHFLQRSNRSKNIELIGVFRDGKGVSTRLLKILRPTKDGPKGRTDRALIEELRAYGLEFKGGF